MLAVKTLPAQSQKPGSTEDKLQEVAEYLEANAVQPEVGLIEVKTWLYDDGEKSLHRNTEIWLNEDSSLYRSSDADDPEGEDWSHVIMVNPDYRAAILRNKASRQWEIKGLSLAGDPRYEQLHDSHADSHPSADYLVAGPSWLPTEFRKFDIISHQVEERDVGDVDVWGIRGIAENKNSGREMWEIEREIVVTHEKPYRLLEYRYPLLPAIYRQIVRFKDWSRNGDTIFPQQQDLLKVVEEGGPEQLSARTRRTYTESIEGWNPDAVRLSYYGLPEPGERSNIGLVFLYLAAGILLLGLGIWVAKKKSAV